MEEAKIGACAQADGKECRGEDPHRVLETQEGMDSRARVET